MTEGRMQDEVGFAILGPLEVRRGGRSVPIRSPKYRIVLAALLLNAGSLVTVYRRGEALALNALGWDHAQLGEADTAIHYCRQALRLCDELGDASTASSTWDSLGFAYRVRGDRGAAVEAYGTSLRLRRRTGMLLQEAHTQVALGDAYEAFGELDAARAAWRVGLTSLDKINACDARDVRWRVGHHLGREDGRDRVFPVVQVA